MKNTKKILSVALAGALAFGSMGSAFAAGTLTEGIDNQDVVKAVEKLNALGIVNGMEDGKYHEELNVTREQFAKLLVESLGLGNAAQAATGSTQFGDVESDRWSSGYINVAVGQGLIKGYPDGTFKPAQEVSYAEAVTMLVRALGYKDEFLAGSWPGNYVAKGAELDITDDVDFTAGGLADRGSVAVMVSNTLDAKVLEQGSYGDENSWEESDETLLENRIGYEKIEDAQVIAVPRVDSSIDEDQVTVKYTDEDGKEVTKTFDVEDNVSIFNSLGEGVNVYLDDNDIVYLEKSDEDFKVYYDLVDEGEDIEKDEFTLYNIEKTLDVDDEEVVYYIDNEEVDFDEFKEIAEKGNLVVKAVTDEKGNVVVVDAQKYEKSVVAVSADSDKLVYFDNDEDTEELKVDDYDKVVVVDAQGNEMKLEDINENDIVYINENDKDGDTLEEASSKEEVLYLGVVRNSVQGSADSYTDSELEIDGTDYDVATNATLSVDSNNEVELYANSTDELDDITGEEAQVVALLDFKGEIRHISTDIETSSNDMYGVIVGKETSFGDYSVKLVNTQGKTVEYDLDIDAEDFKGGYTSETDIADNDIVKFTLDSDGEIDSLTKIASIANDGADADSDVDVTLGTGDDDVTVAQDSLESSKEVDEDYIVFANDGSISVDEDIIVLDYTAAYNTDGDEVSDVEDIEIVKYADLVEKTPNTGSEAIYVSDKDTGAIEFMIFTKNFDLNDDALAGYVVDTKISDGTLYVDMIEEGTNEEVRYEVNSGTVEDETIVLFEKNSDGTIDILGKAAGDKADDYEIVEGTVADIDGKYVKVGTKTYKLDSDAIFYEEDDKQSSSDLDEGDKVVLAIEGTMIKVVKLIDEDEESTNETADYTLASADDTSAQVTGAVYDAQKAENNTYILKITNEDTNEVVGYSSADTLADANDDTLDFTINNITKTAKYKFELYRDGVAELVKSFEKFIVK